MLRRPRALKALPRSAHRSGSVLAHRTYARPSSAWK